MTYYCCKAFLFVLFYFIQASVCVSNWPPKSDIQTRLLEDDELDGQVTLYLHHSLEPSDLPQKYVPRGIITIHSARNEAIYNEETPLSSPDIEKLKKLAADDDIYRVKLLSKYDESSHSVISYTKACAVYESGLTDAVTVAVDQSGLPIAVAVSTLPPYCTGVVPNSKLTSFNTTVNLVSLANGPSPDTLTYIQRIEQEKAEKARGEQGDNRSFFSKYWMYIVPFVLFLFISGASGPEGQSGGR